MDWRSIVLGKFSWWRLVRFPIILYVALLIVGAFFSDRLIFPYRGCSYERGDYGISESLTKSMVYGTLYQQAKEERFLALYFHGNGVDIGMLWPLVAELNERGISVLAIDYPDYGLSRSLLPRDGFYENSILRDPHHVGPTEQSCREAAFFLYQKATSMGYTNDQIVVWGRSIGSGVATDLVHLLEQAHAKDDPLRGLMLDSPFKSAFTTKTMVPILPFDKFENLQKIKELQTPTFILHGQEDRVISVSHSKALYEAHSGKKERHVIPDAGHSDLWNYVEEHHWARLLAFFD